MEQHASFSKYHKARDDIHEALTFTSTNTVESTQAV